MLVKKSRKLKIKIKSASSIELLENEYSNKISKNLNNQEFHENLVSEMVSKNIFKFAKLSKKKVPKFQEQQSIFSNYIQNLIE